jgi:hypothetical protein
MVFVHPGIVPEVAARPTWLKRVVTVRSAPRELADEAQSVLLLNLVQARSGPRRVSLRANKVVVVSVKGAESFRIHLGLLLAELICIPAFVIEVSRALAFTRCTCGERCCVRCELSAKTRRRQCCRSNPTTRSLKRGTPTWPNCTSPNRSRVPRASTIDSRRVAIRRDRQSRDWLDRQDLGVSRAALSSPFDSLLWDRARLERLFQIVYRFEA